MDTVDISTTEPVKIVFAEEDHADEEVMVVTPKLAAAPEDLGDEDKDNLITETVFGDLVTKVDDTVLVFTHTTTSPGQWSN